MPSLKMFHQRIDVFSFLALLLEIITRSKNSTAGDSDKALNFQTNVNIISFLLITKTWWKIWCRTCNRYGTVTPKGWHCNWLTDYLMGTPAAKWCDVSTSSLCKKAFKLQVKHMFGCCDANQRLDKAPVPTKAGKSSLGLSSWCSMINFLRPCPLVRLIWAYHLQYLITRASCWTRQVTQEADTSFFLPPRARLYY